MKRKLSFWLNIVTICLCCCAICIGIYAATTANLTISGQIGFTAHGCNVSVSGYIFGHSLTKDGLPVPESNKEWFDDGKAETVGSANIIEINGTTKPLDIGERYFSDMASTDEAGTPETIFIVFNITNDSDFNIETTVDDIVPPTGVVVNVAPQYVEIAKDTTVSVVITMICNSTENIDVQNDIDNFSAAINFKKAKSSNISFEQVCDVLTVICEDYGYSTAPVAFLSNKTKTISNYTDLKAPFNINKNYFQSVPNINLSNYVDNNQFYSIYDTILQAMSAEISNNTLKLYEVKKFTVDEGTQFETDVYYYLSTMGNLIIIDWASEMYVNAANTGVWAQNTCVGYRIIVDYDLQNFDTETYVVKQSSTIQRTDGLFGYSLIYQSVKMGQLQDCGYADFVIAYDDGIIKSSTSSLVVENIDMINNKACFLRGENGLFWYANEIKQYEQEISTDETFPIVASVLSMITEIDKTPSIIYNLFCTENNPYKNYKKM